MKKIITTVVLALVPALFFAQSGTFDKFKEIEEVGYISINKGMFEMLSETEVTAKGEGPEELVKALKGLNSVQVFTTSNEKYKKQLAVTVADYLKKNPMEELLTVKEKKSKVKLYINKTGSSKIIKEGILLVEDAGEKGMVLLTFSGNIDLKDLKSLQNK